MSFSGDNSMKKFWPTTFPNNQKMDSQLHMPKCKQLVRGNICTDGKRARSRQRRVCGWMRLRRWVGIVGLVMWHARMTRVIRRERDCH